MAIETTPGKLLLSDILPKDVPLRPLDKKQMASLLAEIGRKYPELYREISAKLTKLSAEIARREVVGSFDLEHLKPTKASENAKKNILKKIEDLVLSSKDFDKVYNDIIVYLSDISQKLTDSVYEEAISTGNPLAHQVASGARGNKMQLKRLIGGDTLYLGHKDEAIPIPVVNSYSAGVTPAEFWSATYGARRGLAETKLGVADTGYLLKLFVRATHRLVVTAIDGPSDYPFPVGMPVDIDDVDNEGALLAIDTGPYKRNTVLTPEVIEVLKAKGYKKLLIRSPITSLAPQGLYARDVGLRENGELPALGSIPGITAAQAIGERLAQTSLSAKHTGGVKGRETGFAIIERIVNVPKRFKGGATHAVVDGKVTKIVKNELGQTIVYINDTPHTIDPEFESTVKVGDYLEAGDVISTGIPNPAMFVAFKGIGEGRRRFVEQFVKEMILAGQPVHRRNVELLARGLIDHVEITESFNEYLPGDIVPYSTIVSQWKPREDSIYLPVSEAEGYYLENPVLHYSIGTKLKRSMIKELNEFGIKKVLVNKNPPPFVPVMIRATAILEFDPNWITKMFGANHLRMLLQAARQGAEAPIYDTSFVPAKVMGIPLSNWIKKIVS